MAVLNILFRFLSWLQPLWTRGIIEKSKNETASGHVCPKASSCWQEFVDHELVEHCTLMPKIFSVFLPKYCICFESSFCIPFSRTYCIYNSPLAYWICLKKRFTFHSFIFCKLFPEVFLVGLVISLSSGNLPELIWTWSQLSEGCLQNTGNPRERKCYFPGKKTLSQFGQTL